MEQQQIKGVGGGGGGLLVFQYLFYTSILLRFRYTHGFVKYGILPFKHFPVF